MSPIAEVVVDHPTQTVIDQVDRLYVQKAITHADDRTLVTTIAAQRHALDHPLTAALAITLADGRSIRITKYVPPEGEAGRVHIEKRDFATPAAELDARVAVLRQASPALTPMQAQQQILKAHPDLYDRHVAAMRSGTGYPALVEKQAPPSVEAILKQATAQAIYQAYRAYHLGQGQADAVLGEQRQG